VRGERQQRGRGGHGPLRGSRAGDRFALTLISLALDEVDATQVRDRRRESERQTRAEPNQPGRARRRQLDRTVLSAAETEAIVRAEMARRRLVDG
jgi:hypothetical protein